MTPMTDKRRRERMLPPKMMLMICRSVLLEQTTEDQVKLQEVMRRFEAAINEPISGLDDKHKARLARGVQALADDIFMELFSRPAVTAMRAAAFLMQRIVVEGGADLTEWPVFIEPYSAFVEAVHADDGNIERLGAVERSARRMAEKQWGRLRTLDLYRPMRGQDGAP